MIAPSSSQLLASVGHQGMTCPSYSLLVRIFASRAFINATSSSRSLSANALTSASRSGSAATSELLGGLLVANTTNEDLFLTDTEKTSLLEKGYTEEQLDAILYG